MMYRFGTTLVGMAYMLIPFMIIAVYNSVDKLDKSLVEASYDLGASRWKTFLNITLPLTIPGIAGGFTLVFIPSLGMFFVSDLLGGGRTILGNLINTLVTRGRNRPWLQPSVGMIVLVLLVLFIYNRVAKDKGRDCFNECKGGPIPYILSVSVLRCAVRSGFERHLYSLTKALPQLTGQALP